MPVDKAPGPDGFNGLFFKKCWHIIKEDIYQLCNDFFSGSVNLQAINSSFITLIPKTGNPVTPNDFRPISLLNSILKLITKLMADRLQALIIPLIHKNQYGFIKSRTIQDCAWTSEYIHQCQQSKRELVILKLDFEKAFGTIEHDTILKMLQRIGFGETWVGWVQKNFDSGTTSVMLNGIPGKQFQCKRGVRQGDPLSPLLFVMAADLLQCIVNKARSQGLLTLPIEAGPSSNFPIIQYADDTILIMKASQRELFFLKGLLHSFYESTGLRVNYAKSQMIPLNLSHDQALNLASTFGCQLGTLHFTYLGLPLGTTKPRIDDYMPLMDRAEKRLTSISSFLTQAGRLQLVNSVLSSLPTYAMCSLKIPIAVLDFIDRARRHCLWRGSEVNAKGKSLVAWPKVTKPKDKGGLGVIDLRSQNDALLLKHLDKFYNRKDIHW
jgi:hypothetical protein